MTESFDSDKIRDLLTDGFSDRELRRFCFDTSDFRPVYNSTTSNSGKDEIIDKILEHAQQKVLQDQLLTWAREKNPRRYAIWAGERPPEGVSGPPAQDEANYQPGQAGEPPAFPTRPDATSRPAHPLPHPPASVETKRKTSRKRVTVVEWWRKRGYSRNPFEWSNAEEVSEEDWSDAVPNLFELFVLWHVDPNVIIPAHLPAAERDKYKRQLFEGLTGTPTLDWAVSAGTSDVVLIYAPSGGGKTFYRRWAASQIKQDGGLAVEIDDLAAAGIRDLEHISAAALARCITKRVCQHFNIPVGPGSSRNIYTILKRCETQVQQARPVTGPVYVLIDGIDQLFSERPEGVRQNDQALAALAELITTAAKRTGPGRLALRFFMPEQFQPFLEERVGRSGHVRAYRLLWQPEYCEAIVERRLDSCWLDAGEVGQQLPRLLAQDTLDEFVQWLGKQSQLSPRCALELLKRLTDYAYRQVVSSDQQIGAELWHEFVKSGEIAYLCSPGVIYQFSRPGPG